MKKYALISVYDKSNLKELCIYFFKNNIKIISTGNTARYIKKMGFDCVLVSDLTKFKEILDGRVKTLHPYIYASLLFDRSKKSHHKEFDKIKFPPIDFLIVNLYPFEKIKNSKASHKKCLEMIDIGGSTLLRSAAKNFKYVTPICDPLDYNDLIKNLKLKNNTSLNFRKKMSAKVFYTTYMYDKIISDWMLKYDNDLIIKDYKKIKLKYGENPHQNAFFYKKNNNLNFFDNLIYGKQLTYNNLKDAEAAFDCINDFKEPTCVIVKHGSPCGVASNKNIYKAYKESRDADLISSFGGIMAFNKTVDIKVSKIISKNFYEIILAPNFTKSALMLLSKKKNLKLIKTKNIIKKNKFDILSTSNGYLIQEKNNIIFNKKNMKLVSNYKSSKKKMEDLIFAFKVCKHVKSNAIVLVKNKITIAIGGGQTSRIRSTEIALNKIKHKSFVAASDAFFPFTDNIKLLIKKNCTAIIQPNGSINDNKIIDFANKNKLSLFFSKYRFFKH